MKRKPWRFKSNSILGERMELRRSFVEAQVDADGLPKEKAAEQPPQIMTGFIRDEKTGKLNRIEHRPFQPNMIIERGGKRYQLDANGTQRRLK